MADKQPKHWHNQSCFDRKLVCGKVDHSHTDSCYKKGTVILQCSRETHTHGEKCFLQYTKCGY